MTLNNKKNIKPVICLVFTLTMMNGINCYLTFTSTEKGSPGFIHPSYKKKGVGYDIFEDRGVANFLSLVLSDGVGGWSFPSSHMANLLVTTVNNAAIKSKLNEQGGINPLKDIQYNKAADFLSKDLFETILQYTSAVNSVVPTFVQEKEGKVKNINQQTKLTEISNWSIAKRAFELGGAGTLLGSYIKNGDTQNPSLRIYQMGDSLAMLVEEKTFEEDLERKTKYYLPKLITNDMQKSFNAPSQICSNEFNNIDNALNHICKNVEVGKVTAKFGPYAFQRYLEKNLVEFDIPVFKSDVLILGSDGLFDNLPAPLIIIIFNYVLKQLEISKLDGVKEISNPKELVRELIDDFLLIAVNKSEQFHNQLFAKLNQNNDFKVEEKANPRENNIYCTAYDEFVGKDTSIKMERGEIIRIKRQRKTIDVSHEPSEIIVNFDHYDIDNKQTHKSFFNQGEIKRKVRENNYFSVDQLNKHESVENIPYSNSSQSDYKFKDKYQSEHLKSLKNKIAEHLANLKLSGENNKKAEYQRNSFVMKNAQSHT